MKNVCMEKGEFNLFWKVYNVPVYEVIDVGFCISEKASIDPSEQNESTHYKIDFDQNNTNVNITLLV